MTFVIGDIHGCFDKYETMLDKMQPTDKDAVFVLGDIIGIGDNGIKVLQDMMYRTDIYPVLGEQEYMAKKVFPAISSFDSLEKAKSSLTGEDAENLEKWLGMKAEKTIEDFLSLDEEGKESIIDYLSEFQPYEKIKANGKTFVLCHSGIDNFEQEKDLDEYSEEDFVFAKTDYNEIYFSDKYLVTGHTPTVAINKAFMGKVYAKKRHLAIDCGAVYSGRLAGVCLDTLKVYYV